LPYAGHVTSVMRAVLIALFLLALGSAVVPTVSASPCFEIADNPLDGVTITPGPCAESLLGIVERTPGFLIGVANCIIDMVQGQPHYPPLCVIG
jgi:hypothetical protein